ncbi:MAG TPA: HlyD family efflux transporter periplasmic adaptor subunit [Gammaproteobacteria bacterium]|nr:HlyD family efflux transporter periplasmic adaptor subunit [Gammaproteobacteria bacterium]
MADSSPLFRAAALAANRSKSMGEIVLAAPISFRVLAGLAFAVAAAVVAFGVWGRYTEHASLPGQLIPNLGIIAVHTPQPGTIIEKRTVEGQAVERGEVLYVISSERLDGTQGRTYAQIASELEARIRSLAVQIEKTRRLGQSDLASVEAHIAELRSERVRIDAMLADQKQRVALAKEEALRYARIHPQGYVSTEQLVAKREALLEQRSGLRSLERDRGDVERQLGDLDRQRASLPLKYANQAAELERQKASVEEEAARNAAQRQVAIAAPVSGTATAVTGEVGQAVDPATPLLAIVPRGAKLEARLYAPSRAVGFIREGDSVLLRYEAYPYQKFGHYRGVVASVSRAALSPAGADAASRGEGGEPLYRVTVQLASQSVRVYGKPQRLRAGMAVQGDVMLETRRLYEWVLEPLFTLAGRS